MKVIYTTVRDDVGMIFGRDAVCLDVFAAEARRTRNPEITWNTAMELMKSLHIRSIGGCQYRRLKAMLQRIRALHIAVTRPDSTAGVNIRVVETDFVGRPPQGRPYAIRLSPEFFDDVMRWTVRLPHPIVRLFANSPLRYHLVKWLIWRAAYAQSTTEIAWQQLHSERGAGYSRLRAFRGEVKGTLGMLRVAWPEAGMAFLPGRRGLRIAKAETLLLPARPKP